MSTTPYSAAQHRKLTPRPDAKPYDPTDRSKGTVDTPCSAYLQMQPYWAVIDAVQGGTAAMREKGKAFLPEEPYEKPSAYDRRLNRGTFTPWYTRLVRGLVGMVLRKPVTVLDVSAKVKEHLENINLLGDDLSAFAHAVFESAIDHGYTGIFIDYPRSSGGELLSEQVQRGDRPYWIHYPAPEVIGFRYEIVGNRRVFTQVRILHQELEPIGDFGEQMVQKVKVYELDQGQVRWRSFTQVKEKFDQTDEGFISLPFIPFVFLFTNKKKELVIQPPMLEVAYLNVKHYQLSSDLDHALHIAAQPKLVLYGYDTSEGDVSVGVDEALVFDNPAGRAEWIAPPPTSFTALETRIDKIEGQMAVLGLATLVGQKNVGESAEAKKLDRVQGDSIMSVIAQGMQDAFDLCLEYHAAYLGEQPGTCQVNRDFDVATLDAGAIGAYSNLHSKGQISLETLLGLLKKGEIFDDEFSIEDELKAIEVEFQRQSAPPVVNPVEMG
jgi:Domain of unknown function (DUF4055)